MSAFLVTGIIIVIMVLPLLFVVNVTINEALVLYRSDIDVRLTTLLSNVAKNVFFTGTITDIVRKAVSYFVTAATDFVLTIPNKAVNFVIFVYALFHLFIVGEVFLGKVRTMIPLKNKEKLVEHLGGTTYAIMYGIFLVALIEFVIAILGLTVLRVGSPFIWGFFIFLAALLPFIGPSIILIPLVVFKGVQGDFLVVVGLIILWIILLYIDLIVRAKIISDRAKMHPVVMFLGIIGGVNIFGIIGLIVGPLLLSFLTVIIEDYYYELMKAE